MNKILFKTIVGSHAWGMNTPESDTDIFEAFIVPTRDILKGIANCRSTFTVKEKSKVDIASHEIQKVIEMLIDGNVNFLIGVMSPIILEDSETLQELRKIVIENPSRRCYHSIRGLAEHNYKRYIIGSDTAREYDISYKCASIIRTLWFGINILEGNGFVFLPIKKEEGTPENVKYYIETLDETYKSSKLPERLNEEPFREFLYKLRMKELMEREWKNLYRGI